VTLRSDAIFYGDNTEFHNPFREGETIFGVAVRIVADIDVTGRVTLTAGAFANQRFGSEHAFEQVRPVLSLTVRGRRSAFIFGALPPQTSAIPLGPDRGGPHGLLALLQRETLAYDRPLENGLAWNFNGARVKEHFWLAWQRLNTSEHRERFDGGINASLLASEHVTLPLQVHVVHEGGQLYASGPVNDSAAAAMGIDLHRMWAGQYRVGMELFGLGSRYVPDRSRRDLSRDGVAGLARASAEWPGWRAHVIFSRGRNFIADEGDRNYLAIRLNGTRYRGIRDYAESGLARRFTLAENAMIEASARVHRIEEHYEYSFRILSIVAPSWRIR
jgi:hypothetical protein